MENNIVDDLTLNKTCNISKNVKRRYQRWCFVPLCKNTQFNKPEKVFVNVPRAEKRRTQWFLAANRKVPLISKSCFYCCEDHFDLPNDMDNYLRWTIMKGPIKMKDDIVPHIFDCQPLRIAAISLKPRPSTENLQRKQLLREILDENYNDGKATKNQKTTKNEEGHLFLDSNTDVMKTNSVVSVTDDHDLEESNTEDFEIPMKPTKGTNTVRRYYKSREILVKPFTRDFCCSVKASTSDFSCSVIQDTGNFSCWVKPHMLDEAISPVKSPMKPPSLDEQSSITSSEYQLSAEEFESDDENRDKEMGKSILLVIDHFISQDPKNYIGVPQQWYWLIEELSITCQISLQHIKLILMKIKTNDTFLRLGDQFGLSRSGSSKIFGKHVSTIAHMLKPFIFFPEQKSLRKLLPIPFRLNFSNVAGIIDCFEIQIEKPSNALHQALTWSEYKKCNTLKYLICISPDGLITFISEGYGGRVSDVELFSNCEIMKVLPKDSELMVDRGFKQIQTILQKKNIKLVRPPSVSAGEKMSKEEVILTKRVASLRIHVERVIRRLREFSMLEPHATVDHNLLPRINSVVKIASALVNLQDPIIKT